MTGRSAFRFLTNFLLIESNKKMETVDKSSVLFNVGEREARESRVCAEEDVRGKAADEGKGGDWGEGEVQQRRLVARNLDAGVVHGCSSAVWKIVL